MKTTFVSAIMILLFGLSPNELTGKWERKLAGGNILGFRFKPDNSFEAYVNKKPQASGMYTLRGNVFTILSNGCPGIKGTYKINFFSNSDSLRWEVINDSCERRRQGISNIAFGRVKQKVL